jgi:biopolymer transport protein ExbB
MAPNIVIDTFQRGGPVMWPILFTAIVAVAVVLERIFWWTREHGARDLPKREAILEKIETGDLAAASDLARDSRDPVLRMFWHGLNHRHYSLQGALQVAAGIEIERSGRFLAVLDTIVTLAPLLGLLGTVTGIMHSFNFVGNQDLDASKVSGGIAEALIATACGLSIAIFSLVPFNYFGRLVERLRFEMETAATNLELMLEKHKNG